MYWANFLHIYQPPTQKEQIIRRIADESYRKLVTGFKQLGSARLTLNINGILCEQLDRYGGKDILKAIRELLEQDVIELTGSAKYHAFLPLLPEREIEHQIRLNEEVLYKYFGSAWKKRGFFPPEMAYSQSVAKVAQTLGYQWIIADELAAPKKINPSKIYSVAGLDDFYIFFRERNFSFTISSATPDPEGIFQYLGERLNKQEYGITAMDGEMFGHHRPGLEHLLFQLLADKRTMPVMISDLVKHFKDKESIEPRNSTWAVTKKDLQAGTPFDRWQGKANPIQKQQWELTRLAILTCNHEPVSEAAREDLAAALHSDQYWWASAKPWWSLEMIERGAHELKTAIIGAPGASAMQKQQAATLYESIVFTGFEWQRSGLVDTMSRSEDEEVRDFLAERAKMFITKAEYENMIRAREAEMRTAAKNEEYHRAGMIKDRIIELKEEMKKAKS